MGLRTILICFAAGGMIWSGWAAWQDQQTRPLAIVAERILQGDTYEFERLSPVLEYLDGLPRTGCNKGVGHAAVIRMYAAAKAQSPERPDTPDLLQNAEKAVRSALGCSPHDAYLWYGLFWVGSIKGAPTKEDLGFLEMSYRLAPNEAWIGEFRARDAWPLLNQMSEDVQALVRQEYLNLVRDSPRAASSVLRDADQQSRATILSILSMLPLKNREEFARVLDARDITIDIPGIDYKAWYRNNR